VTEPVWIEGLLHIVKKVSSYPVLAIHVLICIPLPSKKWPLPADDFSGEERGQRWIFLEEMASSVS